MILFTYGKTIEPKAAALRFGGATLQTKERREANVYYIFGCDPVWNIHCHPDWAVLHGLQGQKIAATTANSDG